MRVIFLGTPDFVLPVPKKLVRAGHEITTVVTAPPKRVGRKQLLTETPVAKWGGEKRIRILTPENWNEEFWEEVEREWRKIDVAVVAAYGKIIPEKFLSLPRWGFVNVHPSLLPAYRGASPVAGAIVAGEKKTGVTIMRVDAEMDHGPILGQIEMEVGDRISCGELTYELFEKGAEMLVGVLEELERGGRKEREQDHRQASYTRRLTRDDGYLPWGWIRVGMAGKVLREEITPPPLVDVKLRVTSILLYNLIRGLSPWPGVWTKVELGTKTKEQKEVRLKILGAHLENKLPHPCVRGIFFRTKEFSLHPRRWRGFRSKWNERLVIDKVQLEGKKPVSFVQFIKAYPEINQY